MEDQGYIIKKLDKIDDTMTSVLVQQSSLSEKLNQHVTRTDSIIADVKAEVKTFESLEPRIGKIESTIGILKWLLTAVTAIATAVTVAVILKIMGG